jgi:hypothetical protein
MASQRRSVQEISEDANVDEDCWDDGWDEMMIFDQLFLIIIIKNTPIRVVRVVVFAQFCTLIVNQEHFVI